MDEQQHEKLEALPEEVSLVRAVQAGAVDGDRHEVAADTLGHLDGDSPRLGAHLQLCAGSTAVPPRARVFYRELADDIGSVLQARAATRRP